MEDKDIQIMESLKTYLTVNSVESLEAVIASVREAQRIFTGSTQEQVDKVFLAAATAVNRMRIPLAKMAAEEMGVGIIESKP